MRNLILGAFACAAMGLCLAGCAHDSYSIIPGTTASQAAMAADTRACKQEVIHEYFADKPDTGWAGGLGIFGAIGGAAAGAIEASDTPPNAMKLSDMKPAIEACMRAKGYAANADNSP